MKASWPSVDVSLAGLAALILALSAPRAAWADDDIDVLVPAGGAVTPQFNLHGFADVTFRFQRDRSEDGTGTSASGFGLGQFDLFFVSRLAESLSFLGESVFEIGEGGEGVVDLERVFIKYSWSDLVRVAAGRTHTGLGHWNEAFHHGALLQPTIDRPLGLRYEDDGGILPVHTVGLEFSGNAVSGPWSFAYVANLGNGRGLDRETVQVDQDLNRDKAVGFKVSLGHDGAGRVEFGPSFCRDRIPADPATPGRENSISERIPGVHLFLKQSGATLMAEYFRVRHQDQGSRAIWNHDTWYALVTRSQGRLRPYGGLDRLDLADGDPFFPPSDGDRTRLIAGLHFEFDPSNAVKIEYRHDWRQQGTGDAMVVQTAFAF